MGRHFLARPQAVLEGTVARDRVQVSREHRFEGMVGAVVVADDGSLLVAGQERLVVIEPDGTRRPGPRIIAEGVAARNNDGATDLLGRFSSSGTLVARARGESGVPVSRGKRRLVLPFAIDTDLSLSNGLAWSSDGRDVLQRRRHPRRHRLEAGSTRIRSEHANGSYRSTEAHPDGICLDAEGKLSGWPSGAQPR